MMIVLHFQLFCTSLHTVHLLLFCTRFSRTKLKFSLSWLGVTLWAEKYLTQSVSPCTCMYRYLLNTGRTRAESCIIAHRVFEHYGGDGVVVTVIPTGFLSVMAVTEAS